MSAFNYFTNCITQKYADFSGRARRSEYWYFTLFTVLTYIVAALIDGLLGEVIGFPIFIVIVILGLFIPSLAVTIRRLHDTDRSGWWFLLNLIPLGGIVVFIFTLLDSTPGTNKYGRNPKNVGSEEPMEHLIADEV